ncbi:uncharacterized protein LOC113794222 [Dermatophagoides pteronyssinus]|uniref:Uncharacterized protein LOC113794222 n=1 Tax=Dermatophagoides pteronyssinus TaxID=6956 RepID=A0A6P6Y6J2_DERPT|nr:uncharacterized protein LOC113794222 [Dermatophagoides pteronyssinus]
MAMKNGKKSSIRRCNVFKCTLMPATSETTKNDEKITKESTTDRITTINKRPNNNNSFYMKCAKKRQDKGLVILPRNIETKIYKMKKILQRKNLDPNEIRLIVRKKRREEENRLRYDNKRVCFKCRQPGHLVSDCPSIDQSSDDRNELTNICYFCCSNEHKLSECIKYRKQLKQHSANDINLPFAKCFICHQNGHLTRNCSMNKNGAFPNGGKCRSCGSINHTLKECPKNKTKFEDEEEILLPTLNDVGCSVDIDEFSMEKSINQIMENKKIVKF